MKKNLFLLLILAGLGVFVYFYEIKGGEERETAKALEESLLRVEETAIDNITVQRPGEPMVQLSRGDGDRWRLIEPVESSVDRFVVDALVRDLAAAERVRTLEDIAGKSGEFGLNEPQLQVTVEAGGQRQVLKLGSQDYTGNQVYAQLEGDDKVYITSKAVISSASKKISDWRSKTVIDFEQDNVQIVELQGPQGGLRLERTETGWNITQPVQDSADDSAVSGLLSTVKYARIEDFVDEEPSEETIAQYGLDRPHYVFRVKPAGQDEWQTLQLGNKQGEKFYARDLSRRTLYTVRASLADSLDKPADGYRDKKIVKVRQDQLDRVLMRRGEEVLEIRREGESFTLIQPESEKGSETAPYRFWYPLTDAKFQDLDDGQSSPDDARFKNPDIQLEVTTREGQVEAYEFVQQGQSYLARRLTDGRSGTISSADFEKLKLEASSVKIPEQ